MRLTEDMKVYLRDPDVTLYAGDALVVLRELPDTSVDCAVTSPPFYGLRDYGVEGQIGLEATPEEWVERLVEVFREVRRVLVPTGTLWIECGDSYAGGGGGNYGRGLSARQGGQHPTNVRNRRAWLEKAMLKPKDLIGAPFLLAFALRDEGWWWRSMNIWAKPNCLPESVTDRPVVQHSYVMQFAKAARYYHDADSVREPAEWARWGDQTVRKQQPGKASWIGPNSKKYLTQGRTTNGPRSRGNRHQTPGFEQRLVSADGTRALRSVWTIPTEGFSEAHFATWPPALVERILLQACPEQVCRVCGQARRHEADCGHGDYRPGIVLDPFGGSGTTALVARKLTRHAVLIELNEEYCEMAARRLGQLSLLAEGR